MLQKNTQKEAELILRCYMFILSIDWIAISLIHHTFVTFLSVRYMDNNRNDKRYENLLLVCVINIHTRMHSDNYDNCHVMKHLLVWKLSLNNYHRKARNGGDNCSSIPYFEDYIFNLWWYSSMHFHNFAFIFMPLVWVVDVKQSIILKRIQTPTTQSIRL